MSVKRSTDPARKAKLAAWLKNRKTHSEDVGISPAPKDVPIPLTHGQERLWFLQQLYPDNPLYHFSEIFLIEGPLDLGKLQSAFLLLLQRHKILRTTFHFSEESLTQRVTSYSELPWTLFDFRHSEESEQLIREKIRKEVRKPFDLEKGPLFRICLVRMKDELHSLVLSFHHMIVDERSVELLLEELAQLYKSEDLETSLLSPLELQYRDFAYWQRQQELSPQTLSYWKEKLAGELPLLSLPADYPRPENPQNHGAYSYFRLPSIKQTQVEAISKSFGTTPFVFFLAIYKVFLFRYSRLKDIRVGTPFSNRDKSVLEQVMGFFNETQVIRSSLDTDLSFSLLLEQVKKTVFEAFSHKDMPFESLVAALNPERSPGVNPLFQVMFLYSEASKVKGLGPGLKLTQKHFDFGVSKFDLTLMVAQDEEDYTALFEYSTELFSPGTIEGFQNTFRTLSKAVLEDPDQKIGDLPLFSGQEEEQLLRLAAGSKIELPPISSIVELISRWSEQQPHAIATRFQEEVLTYGELGAKARSLAKKLIEQGAGPNTFVGLCSHPSVDLVVGILGILQSGSAYVPLDPAYPSDRIEAMLEDASVQLVVAQKVLVEKYSTQKLNCIALEKATQEEISPSELEALLPPKDREHLAYAIFTSGSSGRPKGVPINHGNLIHSTLARTEFYPQNPECFLLLSSYSFDSSIAGIFWTLSTGGTLVLAEKRMEQDIEKLAQVIFQNRVTHTLMLPSLYGMVLRHSNADLLASLSTVIVAGEACTNTLVEEHFQRLRTANLYNEYGPTEATVWCTAYKFTEEDVQRPISIGKPIANMETYVLDEQMRILPMGVPGELYIGGSGLAGQYLGRPELSAESFVPHPFSKNEGAKLYRSGDLASFRRDGNLLFHGRADDQVKIRGYRVELGEIRDAMLLQESIQDAIVHVLSLEEGSSGSRKQIVAYFTAQEKVNIPLIIQELQKILPDYMVPAAIIQIDTIPKLPNGKVNYKKLPTPQQEDFGNKETHQAPRTLFEEKMVKVWERVLGASPIGVNQNFFQLGGDSLQSIQLIAETRKEGIPMSPVLLFKHPTIAALALELDAEKPTANGVAQKGTAQDPNTQTDREDSYDSIEVNLSSDEIQIILHQMGKGDRG